MSSLVDLAIAGTRSGEFLRLPGLFRRWEFEQVLESDQTFRIEEAGTTSDGTPLFAIYRLFSEAPPRKGLVSTWPST